MGRASHFCASCSLIDFPALFTQDLKCFRVGTLAAVAKRKNCPFCRFVAQIVETTWAKWKDEVWEPSMSNTITVWVKTTLWAHYGDRSKEDHDSPMGHGSPAYFRYRPSLGTDWTPDIRQRSSYGSSRYTLCELDCVEHIKSFKYFTTDTGQDIRQVLSRRRIPPLVDRELLKTWIHECQTNHKNCTSARNNQQIQLRSTGRFRVIDVETLCLFVPSEDINYIAVSYVWGGILHSKTNSERVEWIDSLFYHATSKGSTQPTGPELHNRLRFQKLPLTIQDSISLVKLLGWRYLWIDLLCIRQNDADDKKALVNKMHLIYEEASFTIVAAGGQDANTPLAGLFSSRSPEPAGDVIIRKDSITLAPARPALPDLLAETTWAKRGWTFQEDVLSKCCLYFTATEVFYSCKHHLLEYRLPYGQYTSFGYGRFSEWRESYFLETRISKTAYQDTSRWNDGWTRFGNSSGSLRSKASVLGSHGVAGFCAELDYESAMWNSKEICPGKALYSPGHSCVQQIPAKKVKRLFDEYASSVTEYSKRDLSYSSDVMAAMMGILNKFNDSSAKPVNIEAHGILSDQLEKGLLWMSLDDTSLQRRSGFPSWSWAGWSGSVAYEVAHVLGRSGWAFRPPAFSTKTGSLLMKSLFDVRIDDEHRLFAYLKEPKITTSSETYPPAYGQNQAGNPRILSIYTYTAEISSLTLGSSFVVRQYATSMDVPVLLVKVSNSDDCVTVIPDCRSNLTTTSLSRDLGLYKLVIIGKGQRYQEISRGRYSKLDTADEYIVILLEKKEEYFERVGLSTVPVERPKVPAEQGEVSQKSNVLGGRQRALGHRTSTLGSPSDQSEEVINPGPAWKLQWISLA